MNQYIWALISRAFIDIVEGLVELSASAAAAAASTAPASNSPIITLKIGTY